jgi:hypothetical protein
VRISINKITPRSFPYISSNKQILIIFYNILVHGANNRGFYNVFSVFKAKHVKISGYGKGYCFIETFWDSLGINLGGKKCGQNVHFPASLQTFQLGVGC